MAERFNRTKSNLFKKPVFQAGTADSISELPYIANNYFNTVHHSMKITPIDASEKANAKEVYSNLRDKREKHEPNIKLGLLVRIADKKKFIAG